MLMKPFYQFFFLLISSPRSLSLLLLLFFFLSLLLITKIVFCFLQEALWFPGSLFFQMDFQYFQQFSFLFFFPSNFHWRDTSLPIDLTWHFFFFFKYQLTYMSESISGLYSVPSIYLSLLPLIPHCPGYCTLYSKCRCQVMYVFQLCSFSRLFWLFQSFCFPIYIFKSSCLFP